MILTMLLILDFVTLKRLFVECITIVCRTFLPLLVECITIICRLYYRWNVLQLLVVECIDCRTYYNTIACRTCYDYFQKRV